MQVVVDNVIPIPVPPNADMILASAAGGVFSMDAATQYLSMFAAQKEQLTSCFMMKMIQDEAVKKAKANMDMKQHKLTKENLRKNKIGIEKDKMKKSPQNERYMEALPKSK